MIEYKCVGIAAVICLLTNVVGVSLAFGESADVKVANAKQPIPVLAVWTDCTTYNHEEAAQFASAMGKLWPEIRVLHGCIEPEKALTSRMDFENWQRTLGIADYQTLFVTKTSAELFDSSLYDGYTYPQMKIGFYKQEQSNNAFLLSHELLHLALYEISHGDVACWSVAVHEHYYGGKHPQNISINAGDGWTKTIGIVEHFDC